jgi:hypothetical protein
VKLDDSARFKLGFVQWQWPPPDGCIVVIVLEDQRSPGPPGLSI